MSCGYYQFRRDARRGKKGHAARDAVAASLASAGLDRVNAIARDLAATRIAADSGDLDAMREANDHIERLRAALAEYQSSAPGGKLRFNSALGEYIVE